jgi:hypothetical protein
MLDERTEPSCTDESELGESDVRSAVQEVARLEGLLTSAKLELSRALRHQSDVSKRWSEVLARPPDGVEALQDLPFALDQELRDAQREVQHKLAAVAATHHMLRAANDVAKKADAAFNAQREARRIRKLALEAHAALTSRLDILKDMPDSPLVQRSLAEVRAKIAAGPEQSAELARWEALEKEAKRHLVASQSKLCCLKKDYEQASFSKSIDTSPSLEWDHRERRVRQRHM